MARKLKSNWYKPPSLARLSARPSRPFPMVGDPDCSILCDPSELSPAGAWAFRERMLYAAWLERSGRDLDDVISAQVRATAAE